MQIELVSPSETHRASFLSGLRAFRREGLPWHVAVDLESIERDFGAFVESKLRDTKFPAPDSVPATHFWAIGEGQVVGRISIRHALNDALRVEGGHIGYDTVPQFRGRGVAKEMLRLALPIARSLGLREALITCDDTNAASIRVIEANGGVLRETREIDPKRPLKRYYWFSLA